ncbi:uncharacterized protein LOC125422187 [Ziziphus jujuba]|uniref:Uncharacterized protein LOC125422187 n=1 Tax=Ziziphus jujuba TaxID=326968 RepID=A0ABM3IHT5_ZIZJJ|nr:uncharacterized protein LOC125422187 [Ziziphus jujuba]
MLCKRFTGTILLALLFAHQVLALTRKDVASKQKVLVDGAITSVNKNIGVGGRKLMGKQESMRKETSLREGPINGGSDYSDISGKDSKASADDSLGSPQEKLNTEDIATILEPIQTLKSVSLGTPRNTNINTNPNQYHYNHNEDSKEEQPSLDNSSSSASDINEEIIQKDETRSLLEAAKEIVNLMSKDYKGMGRRKPPINNQEPKH